MSRRSVIFLLCLATSFGIFAGHSPLAQADEASAEPPDGGSSAGDTHHTLAQLERAAEQHAAGPRAAAHKIRASKALLRESQGSPFFQFTATGLFGVAPDVRGTPLFSPANNQVGFGSGGWSPVGGVQVQGVVPLYTWGKLRHVRRAAEAGVQAAEGDRERVVDKLRYQVRRAYFGLLFALDSLQLIDEGKGKLQKALARLNQQLEDGAPNAKPEDAWRLSSALAELEAFEASARQLQASARAALEVLSELEGVQVTECPSERVAYTLKPVSFYRDAARLNRPEGRILDGAVRARRSAVKIASARYFPDLGLAAGIGRTWAPGRTDQLNPFAADGANRTSYAAGLAAKWSLDFWGTHFRTERAEAELDATEALREQANAGIHLEVTAAYEKVRAHQASENAWARGHKDTRAWFLSATQAYQIGTNEPKDVVDAIRAYFKARGAHLDAIRKHNTALAELERTCGVALLADGHQWEPHCE